MTPGTPREDALRLRAVLEAAGGGIVPHARLQAALGERVAGYYMAIHCLGGILFGEAKPPPDAHFAFERKQHAFRVKAQKGVGYQLLRPVCGCCPRSAPEGVAVGTK